MLTSTSCRSKEQALHILFNNASVSTCPLSMAIVAELPCLYQRCHDPPNRRGDRPRIRPSVWYQCPRYVSTYIRVIHSSLQRHILRTGHFYFTKLLIPALLKGAETSPDKKSRVVTTSSVVSYLGKLDFNTFKDGPTRRKQYSTPMYYQSKLVSRRLIDATSSY